MIHSHPVIYIIINMQQNSYWLKASDAWGKGNSEAFKSCVKTYSHDLRGGHYLPMVGVENVGLMQSTNFVNTLF